MNTTERYQRTQTMAREYADGRTLREIAKVHGVSCETVRYHLLEHGVSLNKRGPRRNA